MVIFWTMCDIIYTFYSLSHRMFTFYDLPVEYTHSTVKSCGIYTLYTFYDLPIQCIHSMVWVVECIHSMTLHFLYNLFTWTNLDGCGLFNVWFTSSSTCLWPCNCIDLSSVLFLGVPCRVVDFFNKLKGSSAIALHLTCEIGDFFCLFSLVLLLLDET